MTSRVKTSGVENSPAQDQQPLLSDNQCEALKSRELRAPLLEIMYRPFTPRPAQEKPAEEAAPGTDPPLRCSIAAGCLDCPY